MYNTVLLTANCELKWRNFINIETVSRAVLQYRQQNKTEISTILEEVKIITIDLLCVLNTSIE